MKKCMNRCLLFVVCSILFAVDAKAQANEVESLQYVLKGDHTQQERVDILNKLSHTYTGSSINMAEQVAREALEIATNINYAEGIAASYNNLGIVYSIRGDYTEGLDFFLKTLRIREQEGDLSGQASVSGNISRLFTYQHDYDKALEYAKKSLDIFRKTDDYIAMGKTYVASGRIYVSLGDGDQALAMFELALEIFEKHENKAEQGWTLLQITNAYEILGDYAKAVDYALQAMKLIDEKTDPYTTIELYNSLGSVYVHQKKFKEAVNYLRMAAALADREEDHNGRLNARIKLSRLYQQTGQYDSALMYHKAYTTLYQEVFNAERAQQMAVIENLYQSEKKDKLLELRNQRIEFQATIIVVGSILLVMMIVSGFILYLYYHNKKQHNQKLSKLNQEIFEKHEEILAQAEELTQANEEIGRINESLEAEVKLRTEKIEVQNKKLIEYAYSNAHRVRGPLARIMGLAKLMQNETSPEQLKEYNDHLHASAVDLDTVIRNINKELHNE